MYGNYLVQQWWLSRIPSDKNPSYEALSLLQAKRILMQKIEEDQFLDLMTLKTEVHSVCKEPYRSGLGPYFFSFVPASLAT